MISGCWIGKDVEEQAVMAHFKVLSQRLRGGTEKNTKTLSQDIRSPGRDLNPRPPEYEGGVSTTTFGYIYVGICD
jgi:hypothetical protein